jgi:transcriptional regulator with XRE-family HTH domain
MLGNNFFFTPGMGAMLKGFRVRANLTQTELATRMGITYQSAKAYVSMLEQGKIQHPLLETIVLYVKASGAKTEEFFSQFDALNFVNVDEKLKKIWDSAQVTVAGVKESKQAEVQAAVKQELMRKANTAARKYQRNVASTEPPGKTAPEVLAQRAAKMAEWRMQTSVVEHKVQDYLDEAGVKRLIAIGYLMFARSVFGVIRKQAGDEVKTQKSKVKTADKLAEKWSFVEEQGLDPEIAKKVQEIVAAEWEKMRK